MSRTIIIGDVREKLAELPSDHFHCVVTSPPYWALRDYGVEGQLGLEPTVQEYVANMVAVFREVRRVLRPDGVCWVNIGDTYMSSAGGYSDNGSRGTTSQVSAKTQSAVLSHKQRKPIEGFKAKDRIGVPHRLVFGLQDDGWYFRDEVIWHKPAPMPESVKDRTTKAHEFIFMLSKSPRYFYDVIAASEKSVGDSPGNKSHKGAEAYQGGDEKHRTKVGLCNMTATAQRQPRSVWKIATQPLKAAHFAAYPPELVRRCLVGSVSEKGCCPTCAAPWVRATEKQRRATRPGENNKQHFATNWASHDGGHSTLKYNTPDNHAKVVGNRDAYRHVTETITTGWRQSCKCEPVDPVPCHVLDPFHGAGTTMKVCERLGLDYAGIELNPEYVQLSLERPPVKFPHERIKTAKKRRIKRLAQRELMFGGDADA
jgi:DNA modification methylase